MAPSSPNLASKQTPSGGAVCEVGRLYAGQYLVEGLLGQGGMGEVYLVRHQTLQAEFALKVLRPHYQVRDDIVMRFRAESRALWELKHPGFVQVHHAGDDPELGPYMVMEVLRGKTLGQLLAMMGRIPVDQALPILIEACDTAHAMHLLGIIHRDLKPENIFITLLPDRSRAVKLLDLGAAKIAKYGQPQTAENRTIGTGRYMSPEHIRCQPLGPSSDIYAMGHIAYEILSGEHAFGRNHGGVPTHWDYQAWHLNAEIEPLHRVCPGVPEGLSHVLAQATKKVPEERFQSMSAFANALRSSLREFLVARAKGGTEQMATPGEEGTRTIEEALSRPSPDGLWRLAPSGDRPALGRGSTETFEAQTAKDPISRGRIEAVPKSTHRMADVLERPDVVAYLAVTDGVDAGKSYSLCRQTYVVGRDAGVDVYLPDPSLSGRHARVVVHPTGIIEVFDEKSTNGTAVNDRALEYAVVKHLDRIRFGRVTLELRYRNPEALAISSGTVKLDLSEPAPETKASVPAPLPHELAPTVAAAPARLDRVAGAVPPAGFGATPGAGHPARVAAHPATPVAHPMPMQPHAPALAAPALAAPLPTTPMGVPAARSHDPLVSAPPSGRTQRRATGRVVVIAVLLLCVVLLGAVAAQKFGLVGLSDALLGSPPLALQVSP